MPLAPWGLLQQRTSTDGASPLITMYDDTTGERVELSAVSFANWVAKTANLLVDDLDLEPGDVVTVDLPAHWQSFVLGFAICAAGGVTGTGGRIRVTADGADPTNVDPADADPAGAGAAGAAVLDDDSLVLSLRPMGGGRLTPGPGIDYATEVRLHGDYFPGGAGSEVAAPAASYPAGSRVLTAEPSHDPAFATMLAVLLAGGSMVLVRNEDPTTRERRVANERVTLTV